MLIKVSLEKMEVLTKEQIDEVGLRPLYMVAELDPEKTSIEDIEELKELYDLEVLSY